MQPLEDIDYWYQKIDPWEYQTTPDDIARKDRILKSIPRRAYKKALDIGCGEGWITKDLPADEIYGLEVSDNAAQRFPKNVKRLKEPKGKYDLIVATGVLYKHYDYQKFIDWMLTHKAEDGVIVTCNIQDWEQTLPIESSSTETFPYREYTQVLRVYT